MNKKDILCIFINCILLYFWISSDLYSYLYKLLEYRYSYILEIIPVVIVSSVFSVLGDSDIKERMLNVLKISIISYFLMFCIYFVLITYSLSKFD